LRVARAPAPVFVSADRAQLEQAFVNVVLNARDAMPDGGRLAIAVGERELAATDLAGVSDPPPPGRYGFVEFADTGIGMDDAVRARMFEPFFTTRPAGTATGLGLSVVYGIVRQSGGLVTCESAPGAGATFRLYLPVAGVASRPPSS
jgi:signal transduction histidine kinase